MQQTAPTQADSKVISLTLDVWTCRIESITWRMRFLIHLREAYLNNNRLLALPPKIGQPLPTPEHWSTHALPPNISQPQPTPPPPMFSPTPKIVDYLPNYGSIGWAHIAPLDAHARLSAHLPVGNLLWKPESIYVRGLITLHPEVPVEPRYQQFPRGPVPQRRHRPPPGGHD